MRRRIGKRKRRRRQRERKKETNGMIKDMLSPFPETKRSVYQSFKIKSVK